MTLSDSWQAAGEVEQVLRDSVEGRRFGSIEVRKLLAILGEDADGATAVYIHLTLSDPSGPTWPIDDVQELRRQIRELLVAHPPGMPFYLALGPEHEEPQADEESEAGSA